MKQLEVYYFFVDYTVYVHTPEELIPKRILTCDEKPGSQSRRAVRRYQMK